MASPMPPTLTVVTHPVDTTAHPDHPVDSWRWSVMAGGTPPSDVRYSLNAGIAVDAGEAHAIGDQNAATACQALRTMFGVPATFAHLRLDYDPIPAGETRMNDLG